MGAGKTTKTGKARRLPSSLVELRRGWGETWLARSFEPYSVNRWTEKGGFCDGHKTEEASAQKEQASDQEEQTDTCPKETRIAGSSHM